MMVSRPQRLAFCAALAMSLSGCGIETLSDTGEPDASGSLTSHFQEAPYLPGASWYLYDSTTHAVTPRDQLYIARRGDVTVAFAIASYYDETGKSGAVTLTHRRWDGTQWSAADDLVTPNIKEGSVCVALGPFSLVDCESDQRSLILRTDRRVVPAAGFAVLNPSIYAAGHFSNPDGATRTWTLPEVQLSELTGLTPDALIGTTPADAAPHLDLDHALIGLRLDTNDVWVQATTDMTLVQWRLVELKDGSGEVELTFDVRCAPLAVTAEEQTHLGGAVTRSSTLEWEADSAYAVALVDLCPDDSVAARIAETRALPWGGLWPDSSELGYDLIFERWEGAVSVRITPGSLLWLAGHNDFTGVSVPASLWE